MNTRCPECGNWEMFDGTEEADWHHCECDEPEDNEAEDAVNYFLSLDENGIDTETQET